jgi:aminoglycoside phosphotransferase (APT) family kinase protein
MRRSELSRENQERLASAIDPGTRVIGCAPIVGGLGSRAYALDLVDTRGVLRQYIVKLYSRARLGEHPDAAQREADILDLLRRTGIAAPEPVFVDPTGELAGGPALVLTRLPGAPIYRTSSPEPYVRQLAERLARIHSAAPAALRVSSLPRRAGTLDALAAFRLDRDLERRVPIFAKLRDATMSMALAMPPATAGLVHGESQLSNFLWCDGRLTGVVDWAGAALGDVAEDLASCRQSLAMFFGGEAPKRFLRHYEELRGAMPTIVFWDVFVAARALGKLEVLRRTHFLMRETTSLREARHGAERFAADALAGAHAA